MCRKNQVLLTVGFAVNLTGALPAQGGHVTFIEHVISTTADGARSVFATDVDGGGTNNGTSRADGYNSLTDGLADARSSGSLITEIIDATGDGAGNGLNRPRGITVDASGNVYVAGVSSNNAFEITPGGVITEIIDASGDGAGNTLSQAIAIAVDASSNVYVTGVSSDNAFEITPGGVITEIINATGDGAGNALDWPHGITVDASGNVYVAGRDSNNAFKITPAGVITEIIDATGDGAGNALGLPRGIAVDNSGNVYVTGLLSNNAFRITPGGLVTEIIDATGDAAGNVLSRPWAIAVDASGNVYVAAWSSRNAFKITPGGIITEIIDATGDGAGNALNGPTGIAVDASGNVYVTGGGGPSAGTNNAFMITPGGLITEIIDATGDGAGNVLEDPEGAIAVDASGNVYVPGFLSHNAFKIVVCDTGYSSDGVTCTDDDECTLGTDNCDVNATCTNTPGNFTCTCNSGYSGDGVTCTEVCGDTLCVGPENECNCPADCPVVCGDDCCSSSENIASCPLDCGCDITAGSDCFETRCGTSAIDLRNTPIPADLFAPGSGPFDGVIWFSSSSAQDFGLKWARTALGDACTGDSIPLQMEVMSLKSCTPIEIARNDGSGLTDDWEVELSLSVVASPPGTISVQRTHANGGTFSVEFSVQPAFRFQRLSDPPVSVVYDPPPIEFAPLPLRSVGPASFVDVLDPSIDIGGVVCAVDFIPGVREDPSTGVQCCERFLLSGPGIHLELSPPNCTLFCQTGVCCLPNEPDPANQCDDTLDFSGCVISGGTWMEDWPNCNDEDGDGLANWRETRGSVGAVSACRTGTDPLNPDSDGDACEDRTEVEAGSDPLDLCDSSCGPAPISNDCNGNGREDVCDVACGEGNVCDGLPGSTDCDENGVPDECLGACCATSVTGVAACLEISQAECEAVTPPGVFLGPCVECPAQNAGIAIHDGVLIVHTVGDPVECPGAATRAAGTCVPGAPVTDPWISVENDPGNPGLCHNFGVSNGPCGPIPPGFFRLGSDAFDQPICLEGVPLGSEFGPADTLVRRFGDPFARCDIVPLPSTAAPVDVQIVALSLKSIDPITVTFNGGQNPEEWDVTVDISQMAAQPIGTLTATKEHCNGGTYFTNGFAVLPRFTFTKRSNPAEQVVLDGGQAACSAAFLDIDIAAPASWVHDVDPNAGVVIDECSDFHPGIEDTAPVTSCDCNGNSFTDVCDIEGGSADCNDDGIPDSCQLAGNDCNSNGIPDECEGDCNANGAPDDCDITEGASSDCDGANGNGVPDDCEFDCNNNGTADSCDIARGSSPDVDGNLVPDECQPGLIGRCCLPGGVCVVVPEEVCNANSGGFGGIGTVCAGDANGNGVPDDCEVNTPLPAVGSNSRLKNRYVSFRPNCDGQPVKLQVTLTDSLPHPGLIGSSWWVQAPVIPVPGQFPAPALGAGECAAILGAEATAAEIDWDAAGCQVLHVTGCPIEPTSEYDVRAVVGANESAPLTVATILQPGANWWGDTVGFFNGTEWSPPNGTTNIDDAVAGIKTFQGGSFVPPGPIPPGNMAHLSVPDVEPGNINMVVNIADVFLVVLAFQGNPYPFGPADVDGNCP